MKNIVKTSKDLESVVGTQTMLKYFLVHENDLYRAFKIIIENDVFKVFQRPIIKSIYRAPLNVLQSKWNHQYISLILLRGGWGLKTSDSEL